LGQLPDAFYEYPGTNDYAPLAALSRYRQTRSAAVPSHPLEGRLEALSVRGDPPADIAAEALDRDGQWATLFQRLALPPAARTLSKLVPGKKPKGFSDAVEAVLEQTQRLPAGIDSERVLRGQRVFARHSWAMGNAFFFCSMPVSYASPKAARVLMRTGSLTRDSRRRLLDTGHFIWSVMTPGAFDDGGAGFSEVTRVRLVHARIRRALKAEGWPSTAGDPIDQASMLGTILVLSWAAIAGLERLGVELARADADDLIYAWRAVGVLCGVEPDLLPGSCDEARRQAEVLQRRMWGKSAAGSALTVALVRIVQSYVPMSKLDDWPIDMIRHTAGDSVADLLDLPAGGRTRAFISLASDVWRYGDQLPAVPRLQHGFTVGLIEAQRLPLWFSRLSLARTG
jgi:hypothetical protein